PDLLYSLLTEAWLRKAPKPVAAEPAFRLLTGAVAARSTSIRTSAGRSLRLLDGPGRGSACETPEVTCPGSGQDVQAQEWVQPVDGSPDSGPQLNESPSQVLIHRDRVCGAID